MPYYNQRYLSELIKYDPLASDYLEEYNTYDTAGKSLQEQIGNQEHLQKADNRFSEKTTGHVTNDQIAHMTDNIQGSYSKQGDRVITTNQDQTQNVKEQVNTNSLRTDNLQSETTSNTDTTNTQNKTGNSHEVFSDLPQAGITTTQTMAPDGTVTITSTGYATTTKDISYAENTKDVGNTKSDSLTKNTGTVNTDTDSNLNRDTTTNTDTEQKELWHENGNNTQDQINDRTQNTVDQSMGTADSQTVQKISDQQLSKNSAFGQQQNQSIGNNQRKGRMGISPATLMQLYRDTFLNIDMEIIRELEPLFMGVVKI